MRIAFDREVSVAKDKERAFRNGWSILRASLAVEKRSNDLQFI